MKIRKDLTIDEDINDHLKTEENASELVNDLLKDFYSKNRGMNTDLIQTAKETDDKITELTKKKAESKVEIEQKQYEIDILKLQNTKEILDKKIAEVEDKKREKQLKENLAEEQLKENKIIVRDILMSFCSKDKKITPEQAQVMRDKLYNCLPKNVQPHEMIAEV